MTTRSAATETRQSRSQEEHRIRKRFHIAEQETQYLYHPSFSLPQAEERLWGKGRREVTVREYQLAPEEIEPGQARRNPLDKDDEKHLFLRYNYARYRLARRLAQLTPDHEHRNASRANLWLRRVRTLRRDLVHANLPLVPSLAKRMRSSSVDFSDMLSEGYMALLRAVEKFDVSRGYKFSTYACRAILSSFYCLLRRLQSRRKHIPAYFEPEMEQDDYLEQRHATQHTQATDAVRKVITRSEALLNPIETEVIRQRFPMVARDARQTLAQVGRHLGISNERVRQIERKSLDKLREAIEAELSD
jgi:RNA polymerase primary sigma factor